MKEKAIYDLELFEEIKIKYDGHLMIITITRVPGGWIYLRSIKDSTTETFIPYSDEFKNNEPLEMD